MVPMKSVRCIVCALALFTLAGCGSGKVSVEGSVTFDGEPVGGGSIALTPETGAGVSGGAQIVKGKFEIGSDKNLPPGKYKVEIIWNKKTGKTLPNASDPGTTLEETKQVIPARYNSKTELSADLKPGSNPLTFDLKSGGAVDSGREKGKVKAAGD
jgi:hypothetical protein